MRARMLICILLSGVGLSGCADLAALVYGSHTHAHNSSSLVEFLYPNGKVPPPENSIPQLRVPLRVGLAFLPSSGPESVTSLDAAAKEALLERVRQRFQSRKFIADIVLIPDYYLAGHRGFDGLQGVQRLNNLDLMALVSYDQVTHEDNNNWSLGYLTIVGMYMLKGNRHDVSTLVDLAVVDPATRSLVLRAGGTDTGHGNSTFIDEQRETRMVGSRSFSAATDQMIDHFDTALTQFEADVRAGKANVQIVHKNGAAGAAGGGGKFEWPALLALAMILAFRPAKRRSLPVA